MTHDYKRNGTTMLFAALNVFDGSVIGRGIVEALDVFEYICLRVIARAVGVTPDPLGLQRGD